MTFLEILRLPAQALSARKLLYAFAFLAVFGAVVFPSDLPAYREGGQTASDSALVHFIEDYGRHVTTIAAFGAPIVLRDWTGLKQLLVVTVAGILATHGPKRLLNGIVVFGTRLGERPQSPNSNHNMPSGHSALASAATWFLARRYSWGWLWLGIPVMLLTMWTRLMLNAHTVSAVIAGCLIGLVVASLFVTARNRKREQATA